MVTGIKNKISNSFIGKAYRAVKKALGFALGVMKKVGRAIKKTVKAIYKTVKFAAKAFVKASVFVGKTAIGAARAVGRGVKSAIGTVKKIGIGQALLNVANKFSPAAFVTKMGWKAVKFVGKKVWTGIKKLAFNAFQFFSRLFGFMGKFVNKVGNWVKIIGAGAIDKAYRFIIQPIATILTTVFGFVGGIVLAPINFMKWLVSSIMDRILSAISAIVQQTKKVLKSTLGIFKRVLFNPLTIALIIGGIFFLFKDKLLGWMQTLVGGFRDHIVPMISGFVSGAVKLFSAIWEITKTVGGALIKVVDWITNPKGIIVKSVVFIIKLVGMIKSGIKKMLKATGKSSIDILCMFLAGDWLGIAIHTIAGLCIKLWHWIRDTKFMRIVMGIVNAITAVGKLIGNLGTAMWRSLAGGFMKLIKGDFGGIIDAITAPWKDIWVQIKGIFSGQAFRGVNNETLQEDPTERNSEQARQTKIAVRGLQMKGTVQDNLKFFQEYQRIYANKAGGDIAKKIESMNELYQYNSQQVENYNKFLEDVWEMGSTGPIAAQQILRQLLEDPDNSQRLLSAFFYYDPQDGKTVMLMPASYIGQFLDNIRAMMSDPERDDEEAFKTLIEAFDQLNKERSNIINNQGDVLQDFADKIVKYDRSNKDVVSSGMADVTKYIEKLNKGNLFDKQTSRQSFNQISQGDAKTKRIKSVTGEDELDTNKLFEFKEVKTTSSGQVDVKDNEFVAKEPSEEEKKQNQDKVGQIVQPPGSNPPPPSDTINADEDLLKKYYEHQEKRRQLLATGHTEQQVSGMGYQSMTFDEFKKQYREIHPKTPEQLQKEREDNAKRSSALRLAKIASAYHNQGKTAGLGFKIGDQPTILKVNTNGL